jgi:leader peptidase (prepilin peptidase)/N-methyltransferase
MVVTLGVVVVCAVVGLAIGSFLNVVVWRVPRGESVVSPPSACPACGTPISARDNVPVLGWLLLRGRARCCGAPISVRYPLVEGFTGLAFAGVAWWLGPSWALPAWLYLAAISIALTLIDIDHHRLPNAITYPSYVVGAVLLTLGSLLDGASPAGGGGSQLLRTAIGALALLAFYGLVWFAAAVIYSKPAFGLGDVKLAGILGGYLAWLGWGELIVGAFAGFVFGALGGILLILFGGGGLKSRIPFGPYMIAGAWAAALVGGTLSDWYLGVLGVS